MGRLCFFWLLRLLGPLGLLGLLGPLGLRLGLLGSRLGLVMGEREFAGERELLR